MASDSRPPDIERREGSNIPRPHRRPDNFGRRAGDADPRTNITTKVLIGVVAIVNAFYLVGESVINSGC